MSLVDTWQRPLRSLRLSVTDRCNLRCQYCMPEAEYTWLRREELLSFEEIERLVDVFLDLGVARVRLTGGEPLLRRELPALVSAIAARPRVQDLALTTNGILLTGQAQPLREAGLHRVTVSLDTLRRDRFERLARVDALEEVLRGIDAAHAVFGSLKIDTVVIRHLNDDELVPLLEYARGRDAEIRFIEYMDVGGPTQWTPDQVMGRDEILSRLAAHYGAPTPLQEVSWAPAVRYRLPDGLVFGIIASTTAPFCRTCDRGRLTADGHWFQCLYATTGLDLRAPLRSGASVATLRSLIEHAWRGRADRGAEQRLELAERRTAFLPAGVLRQNRHLEMHTRGG